MPPHESHAPPNADRREVEREPPRAPSVDDVERAHRTCPICGGELAERKCKLFCPRPGCGYFLSCADYY